MQNLFETKSKLQNDCVIYKLVISNKAYIGSTIDLYNRVKGHWQMLQGNRHYCKHLQRCFNKYGKQNLYIDILFKFDELPTKQELLEKEKEYIKLENPIFNNKLDPTTDYNCITTSRKVYQYSLEGEFIKEFPSCREACRQLGISGVSHAANPKIKVMSAHGYQWSYRKIKKLSTYINNSRLAKIKPILVYKDEILIASYKSIADAARELFNSSDNFDSVCACISSVRLGKTKQYKGYNFK